MAIVRNFASCTPVCASSRTGCRCFAGWPVSRRNLVEFHRLSQEHGRILPEGVAEAMAEVCAFRLYRMTQ